MSALTARARLVAVLAVVAGGALAMIATTQTWLTVRVDTATLPVPGTVAAVLASPLSLAALALGLALTIVGRVLRYVLGALAVLLGTALAIVALTVAVDTPVASYAPVVTEATGLGGAGPVAQSVTALTATVWPILAALGGLLVAGGGAWTCATARRWRSRTRRYESVQRGSPGPTRSAGHRSATPGERPADAIDDWDDLSRGDDPTV